MKPAPHLPGLLARQESDYIGSWKAGVVGNYTVVARNRATLITSDMGTWVDGQPDTLVAEQLATWDVAE